MYLCQCQVCHQMRDVQPAAAVKIIITYSNTNMDSRPFKQANNKSYRFDGMRAGVETGRFFGGSFCWSYWRYEEKNEKERVKKNQMKE